MCKVNGGDHLSWRRSLSSDFDHLYSFKYVVREKGTIILKIRAAPLSKGKEPHFYLFLMFQMCYRSTRFPTTCIYLLTIGLSFYCFYLKFLEDFNRCIGPNQFLMVFIIASNVHGNISISLVKSAPPKLAWSDSEQYYYYQECLH